MVMVKEHRHLNTIIKQEVVKEEKGIIIDKKNGNLVACFPVNQADSIMLITNKGQTISCSAKTIRVTGIVSRGVKVLNTAKDEKVVSACLHIKDD